MPTPPPKSTFGERSAVRPVINVLEVVEEVARVVKTGQSNGDLKNFYAYLIAYCKLIRDHLYRVQGISTDTSKRLFSQILRRLQTDSYLGGSGDVAEFQSFCTLWDTVRRTDDDRRKVQVIKAYFNRKASPEDRDTLIQALEKYEDELRNLYPEDTSQLDKDEFVVRKKVQEPSYGVCTAAQSIFKALTSCIDCPCPMQHNFGARLSLGTYRKGETVSDWGQSEQAPDQLDFDMFLTMQHDWHEVCMHTPRERAIQWVEEVHQPPTKKVAKAKTQRVKSLCEPIAKISTLAARRLELKVTRGKLFKLRSEFSTSLIDKTKDPISLEHLLSGGSRSFTERTRRILAVMLSSAVLHLHDTPWLQESWNSSHVLFFRTTSSAVPLRPFVQAPLSKVDEDEETEESDASTGSESDEDEDGIDPDDIDVDPDDFMQHQCPILIMLAVMLMEVYFAVPFSILAKRYNVELTPDDSDSARSARCLDAELVFRACRGEIPENSQFHRAVEACLNPNLWEDEEGERLDDEALRERIYMEIVLPLETELSQAYSSIALGDLDKFAQSLDLASWDRTIVVTDSDRMGKEDGGLPFAQSSLPDLRMTTSGSTLDPRLTLSTSPGVVSPYPPPPPQSFYSSITSGTDRSDTPGSNAPSFSAPIIIPRISSPASMEMDYKASRFFDDEMISEGRALEA